MERSKQENYFREPAVGGRRHNDCWIRSGASGGKKLRRWRR